MDGKVALVTGGTRGIGAATTRLLVAAGWRVAANYRSDEAGAAALKAELGKAVRLFRADVSEEKAIVRLFDDALCHYGRLDGLVNNAGVTAPTVPMRRGGRAGEVAEAIVWLLSDAASFCTGSLLDVSGGR
ncbi:SDR family oxidoreductase [Chromobacterium violaceum]|uniref:SDR family oxidoreductase n=1 Tax=Chromobacterium violaceum TaxID=536 RepID=UPI00143D4EEA|nr:SDR family oxidoreductase [Chromobacterium violaceum]QIY80485.1 SDR family oxidoreductase [Chromobacterium violaceum]